MLANYSLCDTLLRLAEEPQLFVPRWSDEIILETTRTLKDKLGWPHTLVSYFESQLRLSFPEAWVHGHESWITEMTNDQNDRHVVAAAVRCQASLIVTFNLRHFKPVHLMRWNVTAVHPQQFLIRLFDQQPDVVREKLARQATDRNRSLKSLLTVLGKSVPEFTERFNS